MVSKEISKTNCKGQKNALITINEYNQLKLFFEGALGVDNPFKLDELCCKMEHTITPEILDALENLSLKVIQEII